LGYQTVNFHVLVVPFNKALVFLLVVANSGYFTVFTHHIYFIILISMIAGNFVEIRLPKYRVENVSGSLISGDTAAYNLPQPKEFFPSTIFEIFSSVLAYRFF
jgi:hypothetical protein